MAGEQEELTVLDVASSEAGPRLDVYLAARLGGMSRAKVQRLIDAGAVSVNGAPARARQAVRGGDQVVVRRLPPSPSSLAPVALPLAILYEDEELIVLDKPAGLAVHPGAGAGGVTLVHALLAHAGTLARGAARDPGAASRPGIVHRLDKDTTGVMVCAKTDLALADLSRQFHDRTAIVREYVALLDGTLPADVVTHESYLYRDPTSRVRFASVGVASYRQHRARAGLRASRFRYAKSVFKRQTEYAGRLTLARVRLFTGRTHQIRVHAKDLGAAIVGDLVYHRPVTLPLDFAPDVRAALAGVERQLLHARTLGFRHPKSGATMCFEAPYPDDFAKLLAMLAPCEGGLPTREGW